jgi:hypothetical protein
VDTGQAQIVLLSMGGSAVSLSLYIALLSDSSPDAALDSNLQQAEDAD